MPNSLFHLQFPSPEAAFGIVQNLLFESLDGYDTTHDVGADVVLSPDLVELYTHLTNITAATLKKFQTYPTQDFTWEKKRTFKTAVHVEHGNDPDALNYLCQGQPLAAGIGIGFQFINDGILGVWNDGYGPYSVPLVTGLGNAWEATYILRFTLEALEYIAFYVNDALIAIVNTGLPFGTVDASYLINAHVENTVAIQHRLKLSHIFFNQDL